MLWDEEYLFQVRANDMSCKGLMKEHFDSEISDLNFTGVSWASQWSAN